RNRAPPALHPPPSPAFAAGASEDGGTRPPPAVPPFTLPGLPLAGPLVPGVPSLGAPPFVPSAVPLGSLEGPAAGAGVALFTVQPSAALESVKMSGRPTIALGPPAVIERTQ